MDSVESYKDKLAYFHIEDLKDVLTYIGFPKEGTKQDLVDRILDVLSDDRGSWAETKEKAANLVDDAYSRIKVSGAADLASKSKDTSDDLYVELKEIVKELDEMAKVRCICGRKVASDSMIKCVDPSSGVWQHMACVLIAENPRDGIVQSPPDVFYCELCRLSRADPFWANVSHPLYPVKLKLGRFPADDDKSTERTFRLTRPEWDLLSKQEYDVQAWSMLLNDEVLFRLRWPKYPDLYINGVPVKVIDRPPHILLAPSGRDDGPLVTPCIRDGINKISLQACDTRMFCVGVRIVKQRTLNQVLNMIPKEADGEPFEEALARVRRCLGGGNASGNPDSDSDVEVIADFIPINLCCPISSSRMKVAARFKPCPHMGCFDLEVYVEMNQSTRKWQCPICVKNYSWEDIVIDPYFNRITSKMRDLSGDVASVEVKPDGSWRAKSDGDGSDGLGELGMWHLPDGNIRLSPSRDAEVDRKDLDGEFADKCRIGKGNR